MWVYVFALKCIGACEKAQQAGQTVVASRKNRVTGDQEVGGGFSFHMFLYLQRYRVTITKSKGIISTMMSVSGQWVVESLAEKPADIIMEVKISAQKS